MRRTRFFVFMVMMAAVGCGGNVSSDDGNVGEVGKADEVDPTGHENEGYLLVKSPATTRGFYAAPYLTYRGTSVQPDAKGRFTNGTGCLGIYNSLMSDCAVAISAKQTTTYELASLYVHWDPATLAVDFGPQWTVELTRSGTRLMSSIADAQITQDLLTFPGDFHVEFPNHALLPPVDFSLAAGENKELDLTADKRATIHVVPPSSRNFGNSSCGHGDKLVQRGDNGAIMASMPVSAQADASYRVFPLVAADASHYEVWTADDIATPLTLGVGQTVDFEVKRIDVNNVLVTREDGSTYSTTGQYVISRKDPASGLFQPVLGGCVSTTPSGLDVSPSVYKIVTSWSTADGPDSQEAILDLR